MIVTDNKDLAEKARHLVTQARSRGLEYIHDAVGYNYRLTNMQAAVGLAQMERAEEMLQRRRGIVEQYDQAFNDLPGWTGPGHADGRDKNCWLYTALIDSGKFGMTSRDLMAHLREKQIEARPIFAPVTESSHLRCEDSRDRFSTAYLIWDTGIALPTGSGLSDDQVKTVIDAVCSAGTR